MRTFITLLLLFSFSLPCLAQQREEKYTEQQFQTACSTFYRAPLGPKAKEALKVVTTWVIQSPKVSVQIGPPILNLVRDKESEEDMALVCAFMGGTAQAQLRNKTKGGFEVAGGKKVIAVYRKIQKAKPGYSNPAVEKMVEASKAGKLGAYLKPPKK